MLKYIATKAVSSTVILPSKVVVVLVVAEAVVAEVIVVPAAQTICHMKGMILLDVCRKNYNNPASCF